MNYHSLLQRLFFFFLLFLFPALPVTLNNTAASAAAPPPPPVLLRAVGAVVPGVVDVAVAEGADGGRRRGGCQAGSVRGARGVRHI